MVNQVFCLRFHFITLLSKHIVNSMEQFSPAHAVEGPYWRIISAPVEWLTVRRQEHIQRPATATTDCLYCIHIYMIKIRPFFSVYLYIDEIFVHQGSRFFFFKTFTFHYMAPVAGRITNTHQYRLVLRFCFLQCLLTPGIPIYRVMRMLQQVRTSFINEAIGVCCLH